MKKTLGFALAALLFLGPVIGSECVKENPPIHFQIDDDRLLGSTALGQIRESYEGGRYELFLQEMDDAFEKARLSDQFEEFTTMRMGESSNERWIESLKNLEQEKNRAILQQVIDQSTPFSDKVRSVATTVYTVEEEAAMLKMVEIHQMLPKSGANVDENRLIDLDLEYEYKALHSNLSTEHSGSRFEIRERQIALQMEHRDKMLLVSQSFTDQSLKEQVRLYAKTFDRRLSKNWDQMDLSLLAKGIIKTVDQTEEKVLSTLQAYYEKLGDLAKSFQ